MEKLELMFTLLKNGYKPVSFGLRKATNYSSYVANFAIKTGEAGHQVKRFFDPKLQPKIAETDALSSGIDICSATITTGIFGVGGYLIKKSISDKIQKQIDRIEIEFGRDICEFQPQLDLQKEMIDQHEVRLDEHKIRLDQLEKTVVEYKAYMISQVAMLKHQHSIEMDTLKKRLGLKD